MHEKTGAAFKHTKEYLESLVTVGSVFLSFVSVFTLMFNLGTKSLFKLLTRGLVVSCVFLYVHRLRSTIGDRQKWKKYC